ncbi:hypothetical protein [Mycoplasmoides alvi]|uniref:hypothetical protein n=1 Tax=Mycoplasmoides alvi TaxID=78580 RepID=UPI000697A6B1|nr:hypothetical protein [Mycoplasmoides alvi]
METHYLNQTNQNNQTNYLVLRKFIFALVFHFSKNEKKINSLSNYLGFENLGTKLTIYFQKLEKIFQKYDNSEYHLPMIDFFETTKNIFDDLHGEIIFYWFSIFLKNWYFYKSFDPKLAIIDSLYNATLDIEKKFRLSVKDKSFYSILLPCIKFIYFNKNLDTDELKNKLSVILNSSLKQNINCKSHWSKIRYLGKRSIGIVDPWSYVIYLIFDFFITSNHA